MNIILLLEMENILFMNTSPIMLARKKNSPILHAAMSIELLETYVWPGTHDRGGQHPRAARPNTTAKDDEIAVLCVAALHISEGEI